MTKIIDSFEEQDTDLPPSKSQRKRDMKELQKLGKQLVEAPPHILNTIRMEEVLMKAIVLARTLANDKSQRRQLQYIAKLLSQTETDEIKQALDTFSIQQQKSNNDFHYIETWRDKLIKDGNAALNDLLEKHHNLDRQHLRQLVRNAQKEALEKKTPASSRVIFIYLKNNIKDNEQDLD